MSAIDEALVRRLVNGQFPKWGRLPIRPIAAGGWDNRSFRLGEDMVVRLPSASCYAAQVEKEHRWLRFLAPFLPATIPTPLGLGEATQDYPWPWSIYRWVEGESVAPEAVADSNVFAAGVADFLIALQRIDPKGGPAPGAHNFRRGGLLTTYEAETQAALEDLKSRIDTNAATELWQRATLTAWSRSPVWVHGDISIGNLLSKHGRLTGVIDFGMLGVGDPACDLSIAWTVFRAEARKAFQSKLPYDAATWLRARAWALWKALIIAGDLAQTNALEWRNPWVIIQQVIDKTIEQ